MFTFFAENPVAAVIVACEVGLWVLLGLGMVLRYMARLRRTSTVVLAGIPLLDLVLVIATAVDLHSGAQVGFVHVLAGFYLGSSLAFGPTIVSWADVRFAHRFAGGPAPVKAPKHGPDRVTHLMREWYRVLGTVAIASAVLVMLILFFAAPADQAGLWWWIGRACYRRRRSRSRSADSRTTPSCLATWIGAVPPLASREFTDPSMVSTSRTCGVSSG
jgi:hypothetical protein